MISENKLRWVNSIRTVAAFLVVLLHSAGPFIDQYRQVSTTTWWAANIYDSIARPCVPLFFMTTGYLLINKQESLSVYFEKRMKRVLIPFIAWSAIYTIWKHYVEHSEIFTLPSLLNLIISPAYYHLWYLYAAIGLYFCIPLLRLILQSAPSFILYYYTAIWFVAVSIIPIIEKVTESTSELDFGMVSGFSGYLVLGYLLGDLQNNKKTTIIALILSILSVTITAVGTYILIAYFDNKYSGYYFYGYKSPNVIIHSASVFVILKYYFSTTHYPEIIVKLIDNLSKKSFGIYLIHPLFIYILGVGWLGFSLTGITFNPVLSIPLTAGAVFLASYLMVSIMQKMTLTRSIVS